MPQDQTARALPPAAEHAQRDLRQHEADRAAVAEDHGGLTADLLREEGEARAVGLARRMGVSQATDGHDRPAAARRPGGDQALSRAVPHRSGSGDGDGGEGRHDLVVRFLVAVGLDRGTAEADAEGLEHHASASTLAAFARFVAAQDA